MAQEAGAAATIYRLANGLGDNAATAARDRLSGYIRKLIDQEWPAMEQGWRQQSRNSCIGRKVQALASDPKDGLAAALARLGRAFMARDS